MLAILLCSLSGQSQGESIIVGYYASWMRSTLPAEKIQFSNLTHINHAFAWPEANGEISSYADYPYARLIQETHRAGRKILVSLGGWGNCQGFPPMVANPVSRSKFIANIMQYCLTYGYDGVDFDWEFPGNADDRNNLTLLIDELRHYFNEQDSSLLITMAIPSGDWSGRWFDYTALTNHVNWFGCMTYDYHGSWTNHAGHNSPLYSSSQDLCGSASQSIHYLLSTRKIPKEQVVMGIPFYGKEFNATRLYGSSTGTVTDLRYSDIPGRFALGWIYHWDNTSKVPYLTSPDSRKLITYDDTLSVKLKCEYARDRQLKGVMIWALGQDVIGSEQPLLKTIGRSMNAAIGIAEEINPMFERTISLSQNYPNPFNGSTVIVFQLFKDECIRLEIFDILGNRIAILLNERMPGGWHAVQFHMEGMASGPYFYRLSAETEILTRKMMFIQ